MSRTNPPTRIYTWGSDVAPAPPYGEKWQTKTIVK